MSPRSVSEARFAMAFPAILLFFVMCLAQAIAGLRGGTVLAHGHDLDESGEEGITLEHHHGHHHGHNNQNNNYHDNRHSNQQPGDSKAQEKEDEGFDFYVYSMSYQPEFCRENNEKFVGCKNFQENWEGQLTIHGLWPSRDDGSWPSTCSQEQLDMSLLTGAGLSDDLANRWPNVKAPSVDSSGHTSFWSHEWTKHGTCSGLEQADYFATALDLLLPTPAIVKENYGNVVERAKLEEDYGGEDMSVLVCKYGYLSEVRVCLEKMADGSVGERVTCTESMLKEDSCGEEVKIASFDDARDSATSIE